MQDDQILNQLRDATKDLDYPSEEDHPFDIFTWPSTPNDSARSQVVAHTNSTNIEEVPADQFFSQLDDSDDAPRFRRLQATLDRLVTDLQIFRVPATKTEIAIYLVGRTPANTWAGLHTVSIET